MGCLLICSVLSPLIYLYNLMIKEVEKERRKIEDLETEQDKLENFVFNHNNGDFEQLS